MRALSGLKVLDLSMNLPGPYLTWLLAAFGADILKIENPQAPDPTRVLESDPLHPFPLFGLLNNGKKSITLNLKDAGGKEIFTRLLGRYDILVEGFRPGIMEKLGLGYDVLKKIQPRIIYVSISGFGQKGPYRLKAAHDLNYQALAGCFHSAMIAGAVPQVPSIPIADLAGGSLFGMFGLLSAVIQRGFSGVGQHVDISMFDSVFSLNLLGLCNYMTKQTCPERADSFLCGTQPFYNIYQTMDGRHITLGAVEFKFWKNFCLALEREDLVSRQFGGEPVIRIISEIIRTRSLFDWCLFFKNVDTCVEPILSIEEVMDSEIKKFCPELQPPFHLTGSMPAEYVPPPRLGQHNVQILKKIGFSKKDIEDLRDRGAI